MKVVHKYPLDLGELRRHQMPVGASLLCVKSQQDEIVLYALVDQEETQTEERKFRIAGTGHNLGVENIATLRYIGTVLTYGERLVWHVFEIQS